ncbi:MAG: flagellar basal-body rod protein FlgF [Xanthobacteraceae bacterium]|nr:flagellar basal-body rod protein FlgF [Xanthobacteraceae bacterium]
MENTSLIALSRQVSLERQLDVVANNVANASTAGYKSDSTLFEEFLRSGAHEDNFVGQDRRVSYVQDRGTIRDFAAGPTERTGGPLDVSISGKGFFSVQTPAGERYTRDGSFQLNAQGQLVNSSGYLVLGTNGPITFQQTDHDIKISEDGTITVLEGTTTQQDSLRGKLKLSSFSNLQQLQKQGSNLFSAPPGLAAQPDLKSTVNQGFIEKSNVNAVAEMSRMLEITRTYQSISNLIQQHADLRKNAIQSLADVPN